MNTLLYRITRLTAIAMLAMTVVACSDGGKETEKDGTVTTRRERNYIKEANKHYAGKEYAQAEIANRKALAENASSDVARYNLASSLANQVGEQVQSEADSLFADIANNSTNINASQRSYYNLGNKAYQGEDYARSIEMYKDALRRNPLDDNARENLRLAQLKLQQQQQDQNKDQNKEDQQQQDQQDQQQQQQQQQQQDQQNQDQQNEQNQDKNDQQQDQQQQQQQQQQQPNQNDRKDPKQGGMSQSNAEQILKAMENEENATRRRVEAQQKAERERKSSRRTVEKPW